MPLKDDWETGDTFDAADMNLVAAAVNKVEFDETADDGEKFPAAVRNELAPAISTTDSVDSATALAVLTALGWVDNGDSTWSVG